MHGVTAMGIEIQLQENDGRAIYLQISDQIRSGIGEGCLRPAC